MNWLFAIYTLTHVFHQQANTLINVTPKLSLDQAKASLQSVSDYALSQNGTVVIEELPSWYAFFEKYVIAAQSVSNCYSDMHTTLLNVYLVKNQAVGAIRILGTRLIPAASFESEEGLNAVYNMLVDMLPVSNPNIILGTPFLYNYTEGSTSVTPAWRNSIWHVRHIYLGSLRLLPAYRGLCSSACIKTGILIPLRRKSVGRTGISPK